MDLFRTKKFLNLLNCEVHVLRVREGVVGIFHFDKLDYIVLREFPGDLNGSHFVFCAVDHEDLVCVVHEVPGADIMGFQVIKKLSGNFDLPVVAPEYFLAFVEDRPVIIGDPGGHGIVELYGRTPEYDFLKGIFTFFMKISQGNVGAET